MLGEMQSNFCYTQKQILCSNSCNLHSNSPLQRVRNFNVYHIFSNTKVGMHCTGCSFTSQLRCDTEHFGPCQQLPTDLEVGALCSVEGRYDVERGKHSKDQFELVHGTLEVAMETKAPDFEDCLKVKQDCKAHLEDTMTQTVQ